MKLFAKKNIFILVSFFFIFTLGFLLRAQETISGNFLFLIDQGRDLLAVHDIVFNFHPTLIGPYTSLQGVFQGPLWYYLLAIPIFITQGNPWSTILLMLLISLSMLVIVFFWMKKLFGIQAALVTMFLIAISPEAIAAATFSWNPHPMWLLITLYLFLFYEILQGKQKYHLFLWSTISLMFHFETALAVFIFAATILYFLLFGFKKLRTKFFLIGLTLSGIFFLPQVLFDIRHDFLMSKSFLSVLSGKNQGLAITGEKTHFFGLIKGHLDTFIINYNSSFFYPGFLQNLPLLFFIMLLAGILFAKRFHIISEKENTFIFLPLTIVVLIFLLTCLYPFQIRYWFLTGFEIFYLLPLGLLLSKLLHYPLGKVALGIFFVATVVLLIPKLNKLYLQPDYGGIAKIRGKEDAVNFIYADAKGKPFNLLVFTPPVHTDAYDYLIWWKSKKEHTPIPGNEKKGTFYLLMEPDPDKPWSYDGWLKTVIKTGKVISTTRLPSGLIVEKRVEEK